ncbi:MAG: FAD-dependent oxidoreductase [Dehalococcoidales bacterium]|nr:FAD-dependent oxidoreductase [Dehalococcoidales bacterium]
MSEYPNLFRTLKINKYTYKNRIVTAPMLFPLDFQDPEAGLVHYRKIEDRARGGAAAVIMGEQSVNFADAARMPFRPVDFTRYSGFDFEGFKKYADIIHRYDAVALIELFHPGQAKDPLPGGPNPRGPVGFTREDGVIVDEMDEKMMEQTCEDFATAASFMQAAGFDGILTHSGHGWLFSQFLSPIFNKRTDRYGGRLENRARFPVEIFKRIRKRAGPDFIIEARISGRDGVPGGIEAEEVGRFCKMLEGIVDSVHISAGLYYNPVVTNQFSSMFAEHGCNADLSAEVKKYTSLPVGVVGGINSPELAEQIIAGGKADFIVLARQAIADPDFPTKAFEGREAEIRRCVRCYTCMPGSPHVYKFDMASARRKSGTCSINPQALPPVPLKDIPAPGGSRKVLVAGGGAGGMQAAITAAERGHKVTLAEKSGRLGGILNFTDADVNKEDLRNFKNLLVREVKRQGVNVRLDSEVTPAFIESVRPDAIILALGSSVLTPDIPGIKGALHALDVYNPSNGIGQRVIMVGGGLAGCETALHLAKTGHTVTVIEMLEHLAAESFGMYREALMLEMEKYRVTGKPGTHCLEISPSGVRVENGEGTQEVIKADTVVYALGMKSNSTAVLRTAAGEIPVYEVGDCVKVARVLDAVEAGFMAAMKII